MSQAATAAAAAGRLSRHNSIRSRGTAAAALLLCLSGSGDVLLQQPRFACTPLLKAFRIQVQAALLLLVQHVCILKAQLLQYACEGVTYHCVPLLLAATAAATVAAAITAAAALQAQF